MFLLIDTAEHKIIIGLAKKSALVDYLYVNEKYQTEKLLIQIDQILRKNRIGLKDLKGIIVNKGPGFFTSLRIGIVVSNILGWGLAIPVVGVEVEDGDDQPLSRLEYLLEKGLKLLKKKKQFSPVFPKYGRKPHITKSK